MKIRSASDPRQPTEVIDSARQWQRWLRWLAWLLPILINVVTYFILWYRLVLPGQTVVEFQQASNIIFVTALASLILGIFLYQIQMILAQQVATSVELEKLVTERTQHITEVMEKLDEQNKALLVLDKQKSEFVTLVSHELRAPLTNINGGLEALLSRNKDLSNHTRETLMLVSAEAARLTHFVETILNVSALESGQLPVVLEPTTVDPAIRHVIGQFSSLPNGRLFAELGDSLPPILADGHYLQSVIFHLVDNALKYAPDGPVWVRSFLRDGWVVISVKDSGYGIPSIKTMRLFEKFERLDARDSQSVYGYGLGLYMCKRIMEALNGTIELKDSDEPGATFEVSLPVWEGDISGIILRREQGEVA
jgi:signal transduction histidine kinase